MASYEKLTGRVTTALEMARIVKNHAVASSLFSFAGAINGEQEYSLRHKDGIYFNLKFDNASIRLCMSKSLPNGSYDALIPNKTTAQRTNNTYNKSATVDITYPLVNCFLINTGSFIAIVQEVKNNIYRHTVFGKYEKYGNFEGGEFIGGTKAYSGYVQGTNATAALWGGVDNKAYYLLSPFTFGLDNSSSEYTAGGSWIREGDAYIPLTINSWNTSTSNNEPDIFMKHGYQVSSYFYGIGANQFNGRVPMYPLEWLARFPLSQSRKPMIPMFYTNEICRLNVDNIIPETIVNDDWVCFPITTKLTNVPNEFSTLGHGVAYKIR